MRLLFDMIQSKIIVHFFIRARVIFLVDSPEKLKKNQKLGSPGTAELNREKMDKLELSG